MHNTEKNKLLGDSLTWVLFPGSPSSRGIDAGKHVLTFMHALDKTVEFNSKFLSGCVMMCSFSATHNLPSSPHCQSLYML